MKKVYIINQEWGCHGDSSTAVAATLKDALEYIKELGEEHELGDIVNEEKGADWASVEYDNDVSFFVESEEVIGG